MRTISSARSRTFRCREIAGREIVNGAANSLTVALPEASRATMARRVGSPSAAKIWLRLEAATGVFGRNLTDLLNTAWVRDRQPARRDGFSRRCRRGEASGCFEASMAGGAQAAFDRGEGIHPVARSAQAK